jgi:hypothetical protein
MALTQGNLTVFGPFSIAFKAGSTAKGTYSGLKPDSLTLNVETKKGNVVFEDGTEEDWEEGRKLTAELIISELVTSEMADIEAADNFVLTMSNGKVLTVAATCRCFTDVDNGKTKVTIFKTVALGNDIADVFSIA